MVLKDLKKYITENSIQLFFFLVEKKSKITRKYFVFLAEISDLTFRNAGREKILNKPI
jgi:hypothetical protein